MDEVEGRQLVERLASAFVASLPVELSKLEANLNNGDWSQVRFVSHKLVSTCGNLGFTSMMELSSKIEGDAVSAESLNKNKNSLEENIKQLKNHYTMACDVLTKLAFIKQAA